MGGCTSKQEEQSMRSVKKETSTEKRRGRRHMRRELDEREKVMFDKLRGAEREWRKERKKLREQVKRLSKKLEEREEVKTMKIEEREYWKWVVEQMCVERAVRDEAVEKWKQLYLALKNELDHLIIHTTSSSGEAILQRKLEVKGAEEAIKKMQELRDEVRVKEDTIDSLKEKIGLIDRQKYEKEREIDILRQSLRILGSKKKKKKGASFTSLNLLILKTKCVECT